MPDEFHTHVPSEAASVPPIQTRLRFAAVTSSSFSAADCTLARCWPAARQAALASLHDRASSISVYTGDGDEDDDEVEARSNGKNCGCAALNRRSVAELSFNEKSLLLSWPSVPLRLTVCNIGLVERAGGAHVQVRSYLRW